MVCPSTVQSPVLGALQKCENSEGSERFVD